jgi:hypothetical protein
VAGGRHASFSEAENCCTGQTRTAHPRTIKAVIESKHQLLPDPEDLQFLGGRCRMGRFISDWSALMTLQDPPDPGHFLDSYPFDLSFNFLWLMLL